MRIDGIDAMLTETDVNQSLALAYLRLSPDDRERIDAQVARLKTYCEHRKQSISTASALQLLAKIGIWLNDKPSRLCSR